jgi:hypothetical protein
MFKLLLIAKCCLVLQVPYKPWLEEEPGGDPQATYAYTAADVGAKQRGVYEGAEVRHYTKYKLCINWPDA